MTKKHNKLNCDDADEQPVEALNVSRRQFIKITGLSGLALGLGSVITACRDDSVASAPVASVDKMLQPSEFLHIAPDGKITIQINRLEFGQGSQTGLAQILADELDADWRMIDARLAKAGDAFKDPVFKIQVTGSSSAIRHSFTQYRELGARARAMLVNAAANHWGVSPEQISTSNGLLSGPEGKTASYGELSDAAMAEPVPETVTLKTPDQFNFIGANVPKLDTTRKSTGQQEFGIDKSLPKLKTVLIARPPNLGGTVASFDDTAAKSIDGVDHVMQVDLDFNASGVAVVADGFWPAKLGRDALDVQWNSPHKKTDSDKLKAEYTALLDQPGNPALRNDKVKMENAAQTIVADYSFPYLAHAPMEPLNAVIELVGEGDEQHCNIWSGTQFHSLDLKTVAKVLGISQDQITINTMFAGGGFGRRGTTTSDCLGDAARVIKAWRAAGQSGPLKLVWSREDDIRGGYYRPLAYHRAKVALDEHGEISGWQHKVVSQSLLKGTPFAGQIKNGADPKATEGIADTFYAFPLAVEVHHPEPQVPVLWWRSVGHTHTAFVMETMIDQIALQTEQDPVDLRRKLLKEHPRHLAAIDLAVKKSGYGVRQLPSGQAWGVAMHYCFDSVAMHVVEVSLNDNEIIVHHVTSIIHCNTVVNPRLVEAQIQGSVLMGIGTTMAGAEITFTDGVVDQSNFHDYLIPRMPRMPSIDVHIVESQDPPTGVGEPGLPPIAPAIANAVLTLTGKSLRSLPFKLT